MLIELEGLETYVEERGSGPPLVLVHGLGGSTAIWQKVAGALAERRRVIAYDLRGLGRSRAAEPACSLGTLTDDLRLLLDRLGLDRVALLGHSLGGAVVLAFAAEHGERVSAVVGVAAPSVSPEEQRAHLAERAATALRDGMEPIAALHVERGLRRPAGRSSGRRRRLPKHHRGRQPGRVCGALRRHRRPRPDGTPRDTACSRSALAGRARRDRSGGGCAAPRPPRSTAAGTSSWRAVGTSCRSSGLQTSCATRSSFSRARCGRVPAPAARSRR